jgi:hypothetical protein
MDGPIQYSDVPQIHRAKTITDPIQYSDIPQIHHAKTITDPIQYSDVPQIHRAKTINDPIQYSDIPQIHRAKTMDGPIQYSDVPQIHRAKTMDGPIQYSDVPQIHRAKTITDPIQYSDVPQIHRAKTINDPIQYSDQASTSQSSSSRDGIPHTQMMMDRSFEISMSSSDYLSEASSFAAGDSVRLHPPTAPPSKKGVQNDSFPPSKKGVQNDSPLPSKKGVQNDSSLPSKKGVQNDSFPPSKKGVQNDSSTLTLSTVKPNSPAAAAADSIRVDRRIEFPFDILVCNISAIDLQQVHFLQKVQPAVKVLCDSFFEATQVSEATVMALYRHMVLYCVICSYDITDTVAFHGRRGSGNFPRAAVEVYSAGQVGAEGDSHFSQPGHRDRRG